MTEEIIAGVSLTEMVDGYIETELWSGLDFERCDRYLDHEKVGCTPACLEDSNFPSLDANYDADDLTSDSVEKITEECRAFLTSVAGAGIIIPEDCVWSDAGKFGRDFSLSRNGHGTGLWNRYFAPPYETLGKRLHEIAEPFGTTNYQSNDNQELEYLS